MLYRKYEENVSKKKPILEWMKTKKCPTKMMKFIKGDENIVRNLVRIGNLSLRHLFENKS